jgi:hypothetical protein
MGFSSPNEGSSFTKIGRGAGVSYPNAFSISVTKVFTMFIAGINASFVFSLLIAGRIVTDAFPPPNVSKLQRQCRNLGSKDAHMPSFKKAVHKPGPRTLMNLHFNLLAT